MWRCFSLALLFTVAVLTFTVVDAQDQLGFISLDCGLPQESSPYTDNHTHLNYTSDASFIDSGQNRSVSTEYQNLSTYQLQFFFNVRSFPNGTRNCYTLNATLGKNLTYLIRARFFYGNYDGLNQPPKFNLQLNADFWDTITISNAGSERTTEILHQFSSDYAYVCLINTGYGTPFISTLELRPIKDNDAYPGVTGSTSLRLFQRLDFGGKFSNTVVRYKDDIYDRIWRAFELPGCKSLSTQDAIKFNVNSIPHIVMSTANAPENDDDPINYHWEAPNQGDKFYIFVHLAELQLLQSNQSREFLIYLNEDIWNTAYSPNYLSGYTIYSGNPDIYQNFNFSLQRSKNSTLPPIINAMEIFIETQIAHPITQESDVDAIRNIKSTYQVKRNWQGDPCAPKDYVWNGLNCRYNNDIDPPRIVSLNLSSSNISGEIAASISGLTMIELLDLSNNNLSGEIPYFLSLLESLKILNLKGNNFTGPVPAPLLDKSDKGLLSLSIDRKSSQFAPTTRNKEKKFVIPVVASVTVFLMLVSAIIFWNVTRRKKQKDEGCNLFEMKNPELKHPEIIRITNNFQRVIGKGGFGTVYHGYLGDSQVAVKMLSSSSTQGYKEFQAEANLLMSVHHKNLTSLVGYCNEGPHVGLVYEYMANGSLDRHLSDKSLFVLSWQDRLAIVLDAAQGLEYLHHGCKPPIIHRDVKCTNILLNLNFQAKLSDFGLSRVVSPEGNSHISTIVAGTPGYLDPEYCSSNRLTQKSDVYGFGIVLLEVITGRSAVPRDQETHIVKWVESMVERGDIKSIGDPRLQGVFNVNSMWRATELALACASPSSTTRPTMNYVVTELKECLATERGSYDVESRDLSGVITMNLESEVGPLVR